MITAGNGVNYTEEDINLALWFAHNAQQHGLIEHNIPESREHVNEKTIDDVLDAASELGFQPLGNSMIRIFEERIRDAKVNHGEPKIFTSYFGNHQKLRMYGVTIVNIAQYAPRFVPNTKSFKALAPARDMLKGLKDGTMDKSEFYRRYDEILGKLDATEVIEELKALGEGRDVAICCYEKPPLSCHRHYVQEWLKTNANVEFKEFPFNV